MNGSADVQWLVIPDGEIVMEERSSDMERAVLEGLALEGVRSGRLTVGQARRLLGIASRDEMDGFLKAHGVYLETSIEELERDVARAAQFVNRDDGGRSRGAI